MRVQQIRSHLIRIVPVGAQKLIGDLQDSEIVRFFVVLPDTAELPFAFPIERPRRISIVSIRLDCSPWLENNAYADEDNL